MSYLVVDARDDVIVAECDSARDVRPVLEQIQQEQPQREVFVVWFGEHRGELVSTQSLVTVRGLSAADGLSLYGR
ncbi:MAG TPA: hypothetical protein VFI54_11035 [Solirubrobacteraceae bacterium]|nr:hypothetical protein [Solirubrobacteraceae bacterium]